MSTWELENNWWSNSGACRSYIHVLLFIASLYALRSSKFKYYLAYITYISTTMFTSLLYIPVFLLRPKSPGNIVFIQPAAILISKLLGISWELRNMEFLSVYEVGVLVGNHQSLFDALGIGMIAPYLIKCITVAKKEIFYYWPFGLSAWLSGVIFIDRFNGRQANQALLDTSAILVKLSTKLLIFPEGTRNRKGNTLLPFKKGAFRVAITAQIPILPVVYSPYHFIDSERKFFNGGHMIIKALDPIPTTGMTVDDLDMLIEKTWNVMQEQYKLLKEELCVDINACKP